ncbi:hypothetical protein MTBPR1_70134 [Candidatus Terasakiella magnetica]|uniref:Uncharacterized protein n=1 Tax=Candidatus Terasakiella magnetica TaxID=1867952 RepID=A0A1C3RKL2_9PROT|nr:hypothetical protein [Candidatus Terasakiella magnetica]SCA57862.1 hypothetical protein MTBPR1_70134 [Candidatus Terasakiella magnetica]
MPKNKKALVTLAIGERYEQLWDKYCKNTWGPYAEKHGYDIIVIKRWLDETPREIPRTPHWQKLLILEAEETQGYEDLVWIDTDIAINFVTAPCIVDSNNSDKIGVVRYNETYSPEMLDGGFARTLRQNASQTIRQAGNISFSERYERAGLPGDVDDLINTGVMVLKPEHGKILREVYDTYEENPFSAKENIPLSYHLLKNDLCHGIDGRFNKLFDLELIHSAPYMYVTGTVMDTKQLFHMVNSIFINSFFLHFIEGETRGYMQMVIPGAKHPDVTVQIERDAPRQEFIIGKHKANL